MSKVIKILLPLLVVLCILFGIASGIYYQYSDESNGIIGKTTNFKKGFFRLVLVFSILVSIIGGVFFAHLAKKDELADEDDGDPPPRHYTKPKLAFFSFSFVIFGFVWLVYFIIQWPVYYVFVFVINGFTS
ncbi:MAG: hypothetical protein OXD54_13985 [Candidatus Poribacteria bacterium]|nr:hypothetical protein [Candidatus Poribacteria bacterium]